MRETSKDAAYTLSFAQIDLSDVARVGGKGAHLGALSRLEGVRVPPGFVVTTRAYQQLIARAPELEEPLTRLSQLRADDQDAIHTLSATIRQRIAAIPLPDALATEILQAYARLGQHTAVAVRSSATAEDAPTTSFAGQQDSHLNVVGISAVLRHISLCCASLFTARAVMYRLHHGIDHREVQLAVVVQQMLTPQAAGVLFTADPVTGHRAVSCVEASFGLGEAVVGGLVSPDRYQVRDGEVVAKTINRKQRAIVADATGGTRQTTLEPQQQTQPALTDAQVLRLAQLGRQIQAHFGCPQDIEWCLVEDALHIVQSRPITTLFPIPEGPSEAKRVYVSVGHQQMMTDPMTPLGLSVWQLTAARHMAEAGGRLFVDVTQALAAPASRDALMDNLGRSDPLIKDALQTLLNRGDLPPSPADQAQGAPALGSAPAPAPLEADPDLVTTLIAGSQAAIAALERDIQPHTGAALLDFIEADIQALKRFLFDPKSLQALMSGIQAAWWLNDNLEAWLGVKTAADTLTQSVPNNITSQMGLALLDVADAMRPHPEVVAYLEHLQGDLSLEALAMRPGGPQARDAFTAWLDTYGMRGAGEIDLARPRWRERPAMLIPLLLGHIKRFEPGEAARRFERGRALARAQELALLASLQDAPDGARKAEQTKRMIARVRTFAGYREYPKYAMISHQFIYKRALMEEADRLVRAGVLREREDIFYLRFEELREVVRTHRADAHLIQQRKAALQAYHALRPPRVLTSDGESIIGAYHRADLPSGALVGLAVSSGIVEGRARVILDIAHAKLEAGDILVTAYTDPSWTPLFVAIQGLVTEVGGLTTHGAVIAREYGLPAVVGVEDATRQIKDGQRIRVDGTNGHVEVLSST